MKTVFGFEWPIAEYPELIIAFILFLAVALFFILLRYYQYLQNKKTQSHQLFLFKIKQHGLSNFQVKILNGIVETLRLNDPLLIIKNPDLFESAITNFLSYLKLKKENEESLASICRDIIITYEKLYHPSIFKNPLKKIDEIENNQLLYIITEGNTIFIGKIKNRTQDKFILQIFRNAKTIFKEDIASKIKVYLWRGGDAEYSFNSRISSISDNTVEIDLPEEFNRGKEVRHPFLDVIIPCTIDENISSINEEQNPVEAEKLSKEQDAVIYKLHEDELIMRISKKLNYHQNYVINFMLVDFKMKIIAMLLADKTIHEENVFYYTFRYTEISEAAKNILKNYLQENLKGYKTT